MRSLEIELRHRFRGGTSLDVEFTTEDRVTALFGPSGAGKTSVLLALAGHLTPDAGRIVWGDRVLLDRRRGIAVPPEARRFGVVFQDQRLFPHLDVAGNLRYGQRRRPDGDRGRAPVRMQTILEVLDLADLVARPTANLSGGERQRVALARALLAAPELLLMDEPVAALDEARRSSILTYVERTLETWAIPMIYVSHHRVEVQRIADRVVVLEAGRIVDRGRPDRVLGAAGAATSGEPVNLLRLENPEVVEDGGATARLPGSDASLRLYPEGTTGTAPGSTIHVQLSPSDVILLAAESVAADVGTRMSARNRIPGRVRQLVPRGGWIFVSVEIGDQLLWAEVTPEAADQLELRPGRPVVCLIKTAALTRVP